MGAQLSIKKSMDLRLKQLETPTRYFREHTVLSKQAPEEVLLAILGAHSSLPRTEITRKPNPEENSAALLLTILLQIGS